MLSLLSEIESKDRKPRPYDGSRQAFGKHSTQTEAALEQADAGFKTAPAPLEIFEPATMLMPSLRPTRLAISGNTDSAESHPTKLVHIVGAVITAVGG